MRRVVGKDVLERRLDSLNSERRGVCDLVHDMNVAVPGSGWKLGVNFNGTHDFAFS